MSGGGFGKCLYCSGSIRQQQCRRHWPLLEHIGMHSLPWAHRVIVYSYFKKRCQKKSKKPISQDCKVIWEFLKLAYKRVVKGWSRSRFTENKTVLSQFTKSKIGISRFTEKKKRKRFSLNKSCIPLHFGKLRPKQNLHSCCHFPFTSRSVRC